MAKQIELQEQNNAVLRLLIATLEETAEAAADLTEALNKKLEEMAPRSALVSPSQSGSSFIVVDDNLQPRPLRPVAPNTLPRV